MKRQRKDYSIEMYLSDNEIPARINMETGEVVPVKKKLNNVPEERILWNNGNFKQPSKYGLEWAYNNLNDTQLRMLLKMIEISGKDNTLKPLNDDIGLSILKECFNLSINTIKRNLEVLFQKGVYGKFEVVEASKELTKYWVLNPYISVSQRTVLHDVEGLFSGTEPALYCKFKEKMK